MFNLDAKKVEFALGTREFYFWQGKKSENIVYVVFPLLTLRNQKTLCTLCSHF